VKIWKRIALTATAALAVVGLAACGNKSSSSASSKGYTPKKLTVQFVPSVQASTIQTKAKPLEGLLSKQLGIPVKVSVSTDYNSLIEAMASKKVDVGFLPPDGYVQAHKQKAANVLLMAQRYNVLEPSEKSGTKLVSTYRSSIIGKKSSNIKSIKDLKGKKIAVQDVTSSSGYIWPVVDLMKKGINVVKDDKLVTVKGHDQGVMSVLNGDTDAAFVFEGAPMIVKGDVPDVLSKIRTIYYTKPIPNDTISVRPDMNKAFKNKLAKAFIKVAKSKKGHKIVSSIYSHEGYVRTKDSDFNTVREYQKKAETNEK